MLTVNVQLNSYEDAERFLRSYFGKEVPTAAAPIAAAKEVIQKKDPPKKEAAPAEDAEVTLEAVRKAAEGLIASPAGKLAFKNILAELGAKKLVEVPSDRFAELLQKIKAVS